MSPLWRRRLVLALVGLDVLFFGGWIAREEMARSRGAKVAVPDSHLSWPANAGHPGDAAQFSEIVFASPGWPLSGGHDSLVQCPSGSMVAGLGRGQLVQRLSLLTSPCGAFQASASSPFRS